MQNPSPAEIKKITKIISNIECLWFDRLNLFEGISMDSRNIPWKYPSLLLQKILCEQNGIFLQDNIKKIKYLDRWNATLTLYEARIKLCNQMIQKHYKNNEYIYETENGEKIFDEIGVLTNILDKDIKNTQYLWKKESVYDSQFPTDGSKLFSLEMIFPNPSNWILNQNVSKDYGCANCGKTLVIRQSMIEEDNNKYFIDCDSKSRHGGEEIRSGVCITGTRNSSGWIGWMDEISN